MTPQGDTILYIDERDSPEEAVPALILHVEDEETATVYVFASTPTGFGGIATDAKRINKPDPGALAVYFGGVIETVAITGQQGPAGKDGAAGVQGPAGPQGPIGAQGPQGATGPEGPQGEPGVAATVPVTAPVDTVPPAGSAGATGGAGSGLFPSGPTGASA